MKKCFFLTAAIMLWLISYAIAGDDNDSHYVQARTLSYSGGCDEALGIAFDLIKNDVQDFKNYRIIFNCTGKSKIDIELFLNSMIDKNAEASAPYYALGRYYHEKGMHQKAIEQLKRAYELNSDEIQIIYYLVQAFVHAKQEDTVATFFNASAESQWTARLGLALIEKNKENYEEASKIMENLFQTHPGSWELADFIRDSYYFQEKDDTARKWAYDELQIATVNNDDEKIAESFSNIAAHSMNLGDNITAMEYSVKTAEAFAEIHDWYNEIEWLKNAGMNYRDAGQLHSALQFFRRAEQLAIEKNSYLYQCDIYNSLGKVYLSGFNEPEKALQMLNKGINACLKAEQKSSIYLTVSAAYLKMNDVKNAEYNLKIMRKIFPKPKPWMEIWITSSECHHYITVSNFQKARISCSALFDLPTQSVEDTISNNLLNAKLYYGMKQYDRALSYAQKALDDADKIEEFRYQWNARLILANSLSKQNKYDDAIPFYQQAIDLIEKARYEVASASYRTLFFKSKVDAYNGLLLALWKKYEKNPEPEIISSAFAVVEKARSKSLLDLINRPDDILDPESSAELQESAARISMLQSKIRDAAASGNAGELELNNIKDQLHQAYNRYQLLRETIQPIKRNDFISSSGVSEAEIQKTIPEAAALIEFKMTDEAAFCFIITGNSISWIKLSDQKRIEENIETVAKLVESPDHKATSKFLIASHELYRLIMEPVLRSAGSVNRLILIPDGNLFRVPFEALLLTAPKTKKPNDFLIRHFAVSYAPSAQIFKALNEKESKKIDTAGMKRPAMLAIANPLYDKRFLDTVRSSYNLNKPLGNLAYSKEELENINQLNAYSMETLTGSRASEKNLKLALAPEYDFLHFAVHGILNDKEHGLNGLVLSPGPEEDGVFQVYEIEQLQLKSNLVFLSACNSASGKLHEGEGLLGLSTAFLGAGAARVIGTMWTINDYSTALFVREFYSSLKKSRNDYATALRDAQLNLIEMPQFSSPYYWAGFRLFGSI